MRRNSRSRAAEKIGLPIHLLWLMLLLAGCSSPPSTLERYCAKKLSCFGDTIPSSQDDCENGFRSARDIEFMGRCAPSFEALSCDAFREADQRNDCLIGSEVPAPGTLWLVLKTLVMLAVGFYLLADQRVLIVYTIFAGSMVLLYGIPATIASGIFGGAERSLLLDLGAYTPSFGVIPSALSHMLLAGGYYVVGEKKLLTFPTFIALGYLIACVLDLWPSGTGTFESSHTIGVLSGFGGGLIAIIVQLIIGVYTIGKAVDAWDDVVARQGTRLRYRQD